MIYSGLYHWYPKITGRKLNETLGKVHFVITYIAFFFTFFPQTMAGMEGMPRRIAIYLPQYTNINRLISFFGFILGMATFILLFNLIYSLYAGERVGGNPWRSLTLEWATTSPPPPYNFVGNPVPFEDPYGYGTQEATDYLDALDKRFPPPPPPAAPVIRPQAEPEPATGD